MAKKAEKKSAKKAAKMTIRNTKHKAAESRVTRHKDGSLTLTNEQGTVRISRTPPDARVPPLCPWTLENNETVITGSNTYSGTTTISQGKLTVDGWLTNSAVTVNGGTLGGTGSLTSVTINAGGHLAPGNLDMGVLSIADNMDFESGDLDIFGEESSITSLLIAGNLSLDDNPTLDFTGSLAGGSYTIARYSGLLSGQFATLNIPAGYTPGLSSFQC
jgi:autotransporter-associated beta strand protein